MFRNKRKRLVAPGEQVVPNIIVAGRIRNEDGMGVVNIYISTPHAILNADFRTSSARDFAETILAACDSIPLEHQS